MSDFISNHEKISLLYNTVSCGSERPSKANAVLSADRTYGLNELEQTLREGKKMFLQRDICSQSNRLSEGKCHSNFQENPYVDELEKISTNIIHLLREAKQRTMKVTASCDIAQSPSHLHRLKYLCSRDNRTDRCSMMQRRPANDYRAVPSFTSDPCHERITPLPASSGDTQTPKTSFLDRLVLLNEEIHRGETTNASNGPKRSSTGNGRTLYESGRRTQSDERNSSEDSVSNDKTRQKKDSHNKVERRRRSIISDRINEIKSLLPDHINSESCQKKSEILQEAIQYIKTLQSYLGRLEQLEQKFRGTEDKYKSIVTRIERMESRYRNCYSGNGSSELQTSSVENVDDISPASVSTVEDEYPKNRANFTSSMPKNIYNLDENFDNLATSNSVSNLSLIGDCGIVVDDWQFQI